MVTNSFLNENLVQDKHIEGKSQGFFFGERGVERGEDFLNFGVPTFSQFIPTRFLIVSNYVILKLFPIAREPMGTYFYPRSLTYVARLKGKFTQP